MTWFAFQGMNSGKAVNLAGTQEKQAVVEGFHGYATEKQAEAQPNAINPITQVFADMWIADYRAAVAVGAQPGGPNANITNPATAAKAGAQGVQTAAEKAAAKAAKDALNATGIPKAITSVEQFREALARRGRVASGTHRVLE